MINILTLSVIGTTIAILGFIFTNIWNTTSLRRSNEIQQDTLLHDMVKEEMSNWKYIHEKKEQYDKRNKELPEAVKSHIFNYYEYLAFLILENKIDNNTARRLWKPNIMNMYKTYPVDFLGDRIELKKLYMKWKEEDKMTKPIKSKEKIIDIILLIFSILAPTLSLILFGGMLIEFIKGDHSALMNYAQISLTFFGFTFISLIFERAKPIIEVKRLFYLSLAFLVSAISFYIIYFGSWLNWTGPWSVVSSIALIIFIVLAFGGLAFGILQLLRVLLEYAKKL